MASIKPLGGAFVYYEFHSIRSESSNERSKSCDEESKSKEQEPKSEKQGWKFRDETGRATFRRPDQKVRILIDNRYCLSLKGDDPLHTELSLYEQFTVKLSSDNLINLHAKTFAGKESDWYIDPTLRKLYVYPHAPRAMSEFEARAKCVSSDANFLDFKCEIGFYNRHGVALVGTVNKVQMVFYAHREDEKLRRMNDLDNDFNSDCITAGTFTFRFWCIVSEKIAYLNEEYTTSFSAKSLPKPSSEQKG